MAERELAEFEVTSNDILGLEEGEIKGSGSYGAVYAVTVRGVPRIAKRLLRADVRPSERWGIRETFLNECLLLSKLDHPNVVKFICLLYTSPSPRDATLSRMPSSA